MGKSKKTTKEYKKELRKYNNTKDSSKPGSGKRFVALAKALKAGGAEDPEALAAHIGRKKYGQKKFDSMANNRSKKK